MHTILKLLIHHIKLHVPFSYQCRMLNFRCPNLSTNCIISVFAWISFSEQIYFCVINTYNKLNSMFNKS